MQLSKDQVALVPSIFADLAKIVFASAVVGFFIPGIAGAVTLPTFLIGAASSTGLFILSVAILKSPIR